MTPITSPPTVTPSSVSVVSPAATPSPGSASGPAGGGAPLVRTQAVMGTVVSYKVVPPSNESAAAHIGLARAQAEMERVDRVFSLWRPESPMSRYRAGEAVDERAAAEIEAVLDRCRLARWLSGGWFDPWSMRGGVDPTGLVKGWAAMRALGRLVASGVSGAMVNAGGDIAVAGLAPSGDPWRIGIRHPGHAAGLLGVVQAAGAVATSGLYERGAHVIDPRRGLPSHEVVAATVTGPELDLADALATALMAAGSEAPALSERLPPAGYEAAVVTIAGDLTATPGFPWAA